MNLQRRKHICYGLGLFLLIGLPGCESLKNSSSHSSSNRELQVSDVRLTFDRLVGLPGFEIVQVYGPNLGGTGVYISGNRVLTSLHVVESNGLVNSNDITVVFRGADNGRDWVVRPTGAELIGNGADGILLTGVAPPANVRARVLSSGWVSVGMEVLLVGRDPDNGTFRVLKSTVLRADASDPTGTSWAVGGEVFPGDSGGPVLDMRGNVVGIIRARSYGTRVSYRDYAAGNTVVKVRMSTQFKESQFVGVRSN